MINSFSMQVLPSLNENFDPNIYQISSKKNGYCLDNFQGLSPSYKKNNIKKRNSPTFLTEQHYDFNNIKSSFPTLEIMETNYSNYNNPVYSLGDKKEFSFNEYNKTPHGLQRYHSSPYLHILNLSNILNDLDSNNNNNANETVQANTNYQNERINNNNIPKIINSDLVKSDLLPKQTINQYNNFNYNNDIFQNNNNNNSNNYINNNIFQNNNNSNNYIDKII